MNQYNETLGKTMGKASSLAEVENKLTKDGPAYIKMTLYKAAAQLALQDAAKKAYEAEQAKLKSDDDSLTFWDKVMDVLNRNPGAAGEGSRGIPNTSETADREKKKQAENRRAQVVKDAQNEQKKLEAIAGDSDECDHSIPAQADHPFRAKLTSAFRGKLTTPNA
ncbi:hypothetical protein J3L18_00240 [Mucilaginibacter gossypii]|uniref:hypothetical protein n=1 Tax=Mucilaginibacter gossypii TaxID=551996 RepID=UPI00287F9370|nr:hypothetical protein [Mucilaginibacter gossypii]QTE37531.2 hypothetical protein J3L18_00240 [Mucilaginibacter gossypii]